MLYIHCNFKLTLHSKKLSRKVELYKFFICNIYIYKFIFCNIINVFIYFLFNCKSIDMKGFVELEDRKTALFFP